MRWLATLLVPALFSCGPGGDGNEGGEGQACYPNGTCDSGLECLDGTCVYPSDSGTDAIDGPVWDSLADTSIEVECSSDAECDDADPCTVDTCDADFDTCSHDPVDADGDGYPAQQVGGSSCEGGTDCDDTSADVHPGAEPDCTGVVDMDCDGLDDPDEDGDGYETTACGGDDCDDADALAFPGSLELDCELDRDCNGETDADNDGDGHDGTQCGGDDCDDADEAVNPGESELSCNGVDDDCNGEMSYEEDADHDGYANAACVAPGGQTDCDDEDATIFPGASTTCDMVDDDCTGSWQDESGADDDGDGYLDQDCGGDDCDDTDDTNHPGADGDGDGYMDARCGGNDCDDADDTNYPGADNDGDGYEDARCGGDDCDDFDSSIHPGVTASCTTEDLNCNGHPDRDDDGDGQPAVACGGDDCIDDDPSTTLGECTGVSDCCDGCWQINGCFLDPSSGLMWEDPPMAGEMTWSEASTYCDDLSLAGHGAGAWRLPTISELRTMIRGCPDTQSGGACTATDSCLVHSCWIPECFGCTSLGGPGAGGAYWDPTLEGPINYYWSSSNHGNYPDLAAYVHFENAAVNTATKTSDAVSLRCVTD